MHAFSARNFISEMSGYEAFPDRIAQLTQLLSIKDAEAQRRLGSVEYELDQCKIANKLACDRYEDALSVCSKEIQQLQLNLETSQKEVQQRQSLIEQQSVKLEQLETYLAQLPTSEEYERTTHQLRSAEQRVQELQSLYDRTKRELEGSRQDAEDRDGELKRMREREALLQSQLDGAMQRLGFCASSDQDVPSSNERVTPEFVQDLKFERDQYKSAFEQTKKLLEAETHRAEAAEARQKLDRRELQEQLAREEATLAGLKSTLSTRLREMEQLREAIQRLHTEKQELTSTLLSKQSELARATEMWRSTSGRKRLQLSRCLKTTTQDLTSLVKHMAQIAAGEKPDLARLLSHPLCLGSDITDDGDFGLKSPKCMDASQQGGPFNDGLNESDLEQLLCSMQEIRQTLMQLRQQLIDRYADHLSGKFDCIIN